MNKLAKKSGVPVLRFPEFRDAGEWKEKHLVGVCKMQAGKFVRASEIQEQINDGLHPCYGGNGLRGFTKTHTHAGKYSLIGRQGALCGNITLATEKFHATEHAVVVTPNKGVDTDWLFYMLEYLNLNQYATGQAQPGLSVENLEKVSIKIPEDETEQQKIADCLSSIDELVTAQAQKVEALKAHKKGLMQQLFPAEGETVSKLRFPEFRDEGEWIEMQLGEISDIKTGPFGSVLHESDYVQIGTPIITVEHLGDLGILGNNAPLVSDFDKTRLKAYQLKEGDIVFSRVGSVDRCAITGKNESGWLFSGRLLRLRLLHKKNSAYFLNQLLKHEPYKAKIRDSAVGQTMPSLNTEILRKISIKLPDFVEQQKIADCLTSIDNLITAQTQKLAALKAHKKGLMQQLFPNTEMEHTP